jgi:phosphoglycerate dehydrogenase-like enzyme
VTRPEIRKLVVSLPFRDDQFAELRRRFPDIDIVQCELDDVAEHIQGAQATFSWRIRPAALEKADELAWMQGGGAGVESLLSSDFVAKNITLTNASGVSAPNMAEHAIAMMLAFARGIPRHVIAGQRHAWRDETLGSDDFELGGQTVFVVGTGAIGSEIARRLKAFDMTVVGVRRNPDRELGPGFDGAIGFDALPGRIGEADHVVSSLPLTPNTRGLFDAGLFAQFKQGAYFYNLGRGGTVDQDALITALETNHLAGAGLDVVDPEPLPADHPLWDVRGVLITSHQSGGSNRTIDRLFALAADNLERYVTGQELRNVVNQAEGY